MSKPHSPDNRRAFHCTYCGGQILIPKKLPPTTGPCPHCSKSITSPPPEKEDLDEDFATTPTRLTSRAGIPKKLDASNIVDDLGELENTPIKLGANQYASEEPKPKPAKPRKDAPNKPVLSRNTGEADKSDNHHTQFEQFLIEETRSHTRAMVTTLIVIILILGIGIGGYYYYATKLKAPPQPIDIDDSSDSVSELTPEFINGGWTNNARQILREYLGATTPYGKIPHILGHEQILQEMEKFYDGQPINDLDTPTEAFEVNPLSDNDHQRGLFRMSFRGNPPTNPGDPPKLSDISRRHLIYPKASHGQPTCVDAFFMHTPEGLLIDWHIFVQTKYRTLLRFGRQPSPKRKQTFRALITQDPADPSPPGDSGVHYRISDPANQFDALRAWCDPQSQPGKALAEINWTNDPEAKPTTRTATIELAWRGDGNQRQLVIHKFICWEFLGLGGDSPSDDATTP